MALPGAPAKGAKLGRTPNADWTEVPKTPFDGPWPVDLPPKCGRAKWHTMVELWWRMARSMPHCRLWEESDWLFALETCYLKQELWDAYGGEDGTKTTAWTELRRREDLLGFTAEARRKLRIRYVDVKPEVADDGVDSDVEPVDDPVVEQTQRAGRASVTPIMSRRQRLTQPRTERSA